MLCEKLNKNQNYEIQPKLGFHFYLNNIALDPESNGAALYLVRDSKNILISELSRNFGGVKSINLNLDFGENEKVVLLSKEGFVHIIGSFRQSESAKIKTASSNQKQRQIQQRTSMIDESEPDFKASNKAKVQSNQNQDSQKVSKLVVQKDKPIQQQPPQPLRRSTRNRTVAKSLQSNDAKASRRERQQLRSMANYFKLNEQQLDDDESDESFEKGEENMEDDDDSSDSDDEEQNEVNQQEEIGNKGRKRRYPESRQIQKSQDNVATQISRGVENEKKQDYGTPLNFSIPTRNPYT